MTDPGENHRRLTEAADRLGEAWSADYEAAERGEDRTETGAAHRLALAEYGRVHTEVMGWYPWDEMGQAVTEHPAVTAKKQAAKARAQEEEAIRKREELERDAAEVQEKLRDRERVIEEQESTIQRLRAFLLRKGKHHDA